MPKPTFEDSLFFVHPHDLYLRGAETALPGLAFVVDEPERFSTIELLEDPAIQARLPSGSLLLPFKPAPKIEFLAPAHGWKLLANPSELNRRFESKLLIADAFARTGLPTFSSLVVEPRERSWQSVREELGERIIAQTERGHAGTSSFLLESEEAWQKLQTEQGAYPTKLSAFVEGETWTVNACVTRYGTLVSRPFLQLQNIAGTGAENPLATCGNWHKPIDDALARRLMEEAKRFGDHLAEEGYKGWFGLDVLLSDASHFWIECNPRLTASTGVFTELQVSAGQTSFLLLHVLEFLDHPYDLDLALEQEHLRQGFEESHVVLRRSPSLETSPAVCPGIYSAQGEWLRAGTLFRELGGDEILVRSRSPRIAVPPGEPYAVLFSKMPFSEKTIARICAQA